MSDSEVFISVDMESTGLAPGRYSMINIGAAAYDEFGALLDTFEVNLEMAPGTIMDPSTQTFWDSFPEAYAYCTKDPKPIKEALEMFAAWLKSFGKKPVFVAYPAGFDFTWIYYYFIEYVGECPFSFSALDMKTFAMAVLGTSFHQTTKKTFPADWDKRSAFQHTGLADALAQGFQFFKMLEAARKQREILSGLE